MSAIALQVERPEGADCYVRAGSYMCPKRKGIMSEERDDQERPCLHCMIVELIDDFFAEYPARGASDKVDTDEADDVIDAIAKTVAELTSQQDGVIRQALIDQLMRAIMDYDAEFRREDAGGAAVSHARH